MDWAKRFEEQNKEQEKLTNTMKLLCRCICLQLQEGYFRGICHPEGADEICDGNRKKLKIVTDIIDGLDKGI